MKKKTFHLPRKKSKIKNCFTHFELLLVYAIRAVLITKSVTWELLTFEKVNEVYGSMFLGNFHS